MPTCFNLVYVTRECEYSKCLLLAQCGTRTEYTNSDNWKCYSDGQPVLSAIATARYPALPVTNMMAGLDWEPLINRRRAFGMFMF